MSYATYVEWNDEPTRKPAYFSYKMQCVSHTLGLIESESNEVIIKLKCFYPMDVLTTMKKSKGRGDVKPLDLPKAREYDRCVARSFQGDEVVVVVRLPERGDYIVGIHGYPHGVNDDVKNACGSFIVGYRVRSLSDTPCDLFPEKKGDIYGASWDLQLAGVRVVQPANPIMESVEGKAVIELDRGEYDKDMMFKFYHESDPSEDLNGYMYPETVGNKVKLNLSCPKAGTYACAMYCKVDDDDEDNNTYDFAGQFVIACPEPAVDARPLPSNSTGLWGPGAFIHELGIKLSESMMATSSIHTIHGEGNVTFLVPNGIQTSHNLVTTDGADIGDTHLYAETTAHRNGDRAVNLEIRCPAVGNYRLDLFGNVKGESSMKFCGRWLVICEEPYHGEVFPESHGLWGPNEHSRKVGVKVVSPTSSTIQTHDGEARLIMYLDMEYYLTNKYIHGLFHENKRVDNEQECVYAMVNYNHQDAFVNITYNIKVARKGYYKLILWGDASSCSTLTEIGQWLVRCEAPFYSQLFPELEGLMGSATRAETSHEGNVSMTCSTPDNSRKKGKRLISCERPFNGELFPAQHGMWGPKSHFRKLGLEVVSPVSSTLITSEGNTQLIISMKQDTFHANTFTHGLFKDNVRLQEGSIMAEVTRKQENVLISYNMKLSKRGYYKFKLWGDAKTCKTFSEAGVWLMNCIQPGKEGDVYPKNRKPWGPEESFRQLGLKVKDHDSSTLRFLNGECCLTLESPHGVHTACVLKTVNGKKMDTVSSVQNSDGTTTTFTIRVPEAGFYSFDLYASKTSGSLPWVGKWLVVRDEKDEAEEEQDDDTDEEEQLMDQNDQEHKTRDHTEELGMKRNEDDDEGEQMSGYLDEEQATKEKEEQRVDESEAEEVLDQEQKRQDKIEEQGIESNEDAMEQVSGEA